jgi:hypothetical protein
LDVHAAKVVAASVDGVSGELRFRRLSGHERGGWVLPGVAGAGEGDL